MKICVGIPNGGRVHARLLTDIVAAILAVPQTTWILYAPEGSLGPHNRWLCGKAAVDSDSDYLWLVDNDMAIPRDALLRLLQHGRDLVGAAYNYRGLPQRTVVKRLDERGQIFIPDQLPDSLFECHAIGSGCKLIRVAALKTIPQPWFALDWNEEGCLSKTDDVWFCEQAKKAGIKTYCDPTIPVKHIGDFQY